MKRRRRLRLIRKLRSFRDQCVNLDDEGKIKYLIISLPFVKTINITHSWDSYIEITLTDGHEIFERRFWSIEAIKLAAIQIYKYLINEIK